MTKLRLSMFLLVCILGTSFIPCYAENNVSSNKKSEETLNQDASLLNGPKRRSHKKKGRGRRGQREQKQFRVGIELGGNMSSIKGSDDYKTFMTESMGKAYVASSGYGFQGGIYIDYNINEMIFLEGGLYAMQRPYKETSDVSDSIGSVLYVKSTEKTYNPMYLQMPILFGLNFSLSDNFLINIKAGPYLAYGILGDAKFNQSTTMGGTQLQSVTVTSKYFDSYEGFDFGLRAGAGIEFSQFTLGFFMDYGLLNTLKVAIGNVSAKNFSLGLNIGYKF